MLKTLFFSLASSFPLVLLLLLSLVAPYFLLLKDFLKVSSTSIGSRSFFFSCSLDCLDLEYLKLNQKNFIIIP